MRLPPPEEGPVPFPPELRPPVAEPSLVLTTTGVDVWRLHRGGDPLKLRRYPTGRFRFDAPAGEFSVTYGNTLRLGCLAEVYGDAGIIEATEARERSLYRIRSSEPIKVLTLEDGGTQRAFHLDSRICDTKRYEVTRSWALAFYRWYPEIQGVRYIARHASPGLNFCLFLDRCAPALTAQNLGLLGSLRRTVQAAAGKYHLDSEI